MLAQKAALSTTKKIYLLAGRYRERSFKQKYQADKHRLDTQRLVNCSRQKSCD
jgi:hypothetical protein